MGLWPTHQPCEMSDYRRIYIPGGTYFFTVITYHRHPFLTTSHARKTFKKAWRIIQSRHPFRLIALSLLPDHLHCMWQLPEEDADYSLRWQRIKELFSKNIDTRLIHEQMRDASREWKQERCIWQRRFWEHTIRNQEDYNHHFDYIHFNPVKHGLVRKPLDWPWSTFHRYVTKGFYEPDWGSIEPDNIKDSKTARE